MTKSITIARKRLWDIAERTGWTFVQGGVAVISVSSLDLPYWAVPPIAAAVAALKAYLATKVGNSGTASTLPAELDPAVSE